MKYNAAIIITLLLTDFTQAQWKAALHYPESPVIATGMAAVEEPELSFIPDHFGKFLQQSSERPDGDQKKFKQNNFFKYSGLFLKGMLLNNLPGGFAANPEPPFTKFNTWSASKYNALLRHDSILYH